MNLWKRLLTGIFVIAVVAGCSNVNVGKEADSLLQNQFAGEVDEYVQLYRSFQEVSSSARESVLTAQSEAESGGPGFNNSVAAFDELNNQMTALNKKIYNKKLDIIGGVLMVLKKRGIIRDYKDIKLMETVNQRLISAVKAKLQSK